MTREEAIKEMREKLPWLTEDTKRLVEALVPELAESEDERIRKEIIKYLKLVDKGEGDYAHPIVSGWIAYLEKQKEQKPAEQKVSRSQIHHELLQNGTITMEEYLKLTENLYFPRKQRQGWDEFDEDCLKRAIWYIENPAPSVVKDTNLVLWLKSLPERFNLQPKQEWSEEDEKELDCIINILDRLGYEEFCKSSRDQDIEEERFYYKEIQCLKKLKSLRPQPKQEWSKDDEDNLHRVIRVLDDNDSDWKELSDWLKSLRPSWKPSEEQMKALQNAVNKLAKTDVADSVRLSIMYDNLKKL